MNKQRNLWIAAVSLITMLILAACGSDDPDQTAVTGDVLLTQTFDAAGAWEEGAYPADADTPNATLAIVDGRYQIDFRADRSAALTWGSGVEAYTNVIVDVTLAQLGGDDDNLFGVACRLQEDADGNATGYVLVISGDGHYGIAELSRRSLDFLLEWHQTDVIKQGQAQNTLRAVCVDDYLAVYANGEFLGDVKDGQFPRAGQVALVAGGTNGNTVSVAFDDLTIYKGALDN